MTACVAACVRACMAVCVRACVRACVLTGKSPCSRTYTSVHTRTYAHAHCRCGRLLRAMGRARRVTCVRARVCGSWICACVRVYTCEYVDLCAYGKACGCMRTCTPRHARHAMHACHARTPCTNARTHARMHARTHFPVEVGCVPRLHLLCLFISASLQPWPSILDCSEC